jgi:hypothetical protein
MDTIAGEGTIVGGRKQEGRAVEMRSTAFLMDYMMSAVEVSRTDPSAYSIVCSGASERQ